MNDSLGRYQKATFILPLIFVGFVAPAVHGQFGSILTGEGPVNRSMAGAATATPLSPTGAMYWNPATISGLNRSQLEAGAELLFPTSQLSSKISANALGAGIPQTSLAGSSDSDTGAYPLPNIGLAYLPEGSRLSFGLGVFALAGFGVDYAGSSTNFPLTAPPPAGIGVGPAFSEFQVLQIHPAVSYQLSDNLSIAAGPNLDLAFLKVTPATFAAPDNASGNGFATYPQGAHSESTWGGGFVVGAYYRADDWGFGASFKSPQWFDKFRFDSTDQLGKPRKLDFNLDLPLIVSIGTSYTGFDRFVLALDARYLDYADARFLGDSGFAQDGAVRGLGWKSIFAVAAGAQYQVSDALSVRLGYSWSQNPVRDSQSFVNSISPVIIEHMLSFGASWKVTPDFDLSIAYVHGFENAVEGPLQSPAGAIAGASVRSTAAVDIVVFGASVQFGAPRHGTAAGPAE